ncbi:MAG: PhoU domain-containing protein, partial [Nanoarchaeota archaeon]|nr:PhoU domain-containing protein [Nanoarchaeota archaeon]
ILTDGKSLLQLRRELNAAYIENYREIIFKGKDLKEKSEEILQFIRDLIALEVLELDSTKIVTRDFLDMEKVSIIQLVKKMDIIVRSMLKDCIESFTEKNAENIELRDHDVNRISFLLYRVIRYGMRNQSKIFKNYNLTTVNLLNFYWMTFHLEVIADEAKRIARSMQKLSISKIKQQEFIALIRQAELFYLDMIKAHYDANKERAFELSNRKIPLVNAVNKFYDGIKDTKDVSYMVDRFRRLVSSIHELDRLTYQN